jgi:adenylate cyclase
LPTVAEPRPAVAVVFTDLVGYTTSTQIDEGGAVRRVQAQEQLVRPLLPQFGGREVKSTGDGFLLEFDQALGATLCAIEIQRQARDRSADRDAVPLDLRIGVHFGDVERHGTDLLGHAVNVAARILQSAAPGGVSLSRSVFDQVYGKTPFPLERAPVGNLKGIHGALEVYRVAFPWAPPAAREGEGARPRLAVLPLRNVSPDPENEYLAEGLSTELTAVLARVPGLRVLSRTSTEQYRSTTKSIAQIAAELGTSFVVEGSVRAVGERLRIVLQLTDAGTEEPVWSQTYDRELRDVLAVQTEIAREVAESLQVRFPVDDAQRPDPRRPVDPASYLAYLRGRELVEDALSRSALLEGIAEFERAIALDRTNARAYNAMGSAIRAFKLYQHEGEEANERSIAWIRRALEIDPNLAEAHVSLGSRMRFLPKLDAAEKEIRFGIALDPNIGHHALGLVLEDRGRGEQALTEFALNERSEPFAPLTVFAQAQLLLWLGRVPEAEERIQKLERMATGTALVHWARVSVADQRGDVEGVWTELRWFLERETDPIERECIAAFGHFAAGEREKGRACIVRGRGLPGGDEVRAIGFANFAITRMDVDDCFEWLHRAEAAHELELRVWQWDPRTAPVRADPRFAELLKRANAGGP